MARLEPGASVLTLERRFGSESYRFVELKLKLMQAAESEKSDLPLSQILLLPFLKLRRRCPLYSHFLSFPSSPPPPPQLSALCCLCPCFHSDTFPTQARCNQVSGLRVGVGGWRGSGIVRGAADTRLFQKTDKQDKKVATDLEEAA